MPPEQAADFAALQGMAAGEVAAVEAAQASPAGPDLAEEIGGMAAMLVSALSPALPSLKTIYTPETTGAAAAAIAAVCRKHGWLSGGMFGEWGEEVACAAVLIPLAIATHKGVKGDISAAKEKAAMIEIKKKADYAAHLVVTRNLEGEAGLSAVNAINPKVVQCGPVVMPGAAPVPL